MIPSQSLSTKEEKKIKIFPITDQHLKERHLSFIGCPTLVIPFLHKNYYPTFYWGKTVDDVIQLIRNIQPLIIFNKFHKIPTFEKVPLHLRNENEVFFIRCWNNISSKDWETLKNNICETETHNFTFEWDISHYNDPFFESYKKKAETIRQKSKEFDEKELEELKKIYETSKKKK